MGDDERADQHLHPAGECDEDEMDEAKHNMDKYADYRTYLSFDMQQIVHGDKEMTIGLSKMIKKNSGGMKMLISSFIISPYWFSCSIVNISSWLSIVSSKSDGRICRESSMNIL